ncbi:protocadherin-like wing polarity protein stan isoform X2 [Halyomorpha halys]|uniref:protocadherin-like wing polarity protein stan isoform X2 n=1 Tax=Halyomorpha halys TaxID=286706 RepID=UPI0034D37F87
MRLCILLVLFKLVFCSGYLILLSEEEEPGSLIFDAGLKTNEHHKRHYTINVDKSASFVRRLLRVDHSFGEVYLRQKLQCDGVFYPNLFTLYIDSTSNGTLDYVSIPLRVLIRGCADLISFEDGVFENKIQNKISEAKKWPSETIASFSFPAFNKNEAMSQVCLRSSQVVASLRSLVPRGLGSCNIVLTGVAEPRFGVEPRGGHLVAKEDLCLSTAGLLELPVALEYTCSSNSGLLLHPSQHTIRVYVSFRRSTYEESGRVRRTASRPGDLAFEKPLYIASVLEEQPPGTEVCSVAVKEGGLYSMVSVLDSRSQGMFSIGASTGVVTATARLDRETMDVHYFRVTVTSDTVNSHQSATTTLQINVGDVNDHAPVFEQGVATETTISESSPVGTAVAQLRATDLDIGLNAQVEYKIAGVESGGLDKGDGIFNIDSQSGLLTTRQPLDRETAEVYTVLVEASDKSQPSSTRLSSTVSLVVRIGDENDNYPQFSERATTVSLPEDTPAGASPVIATVRATDADAGQNAALRYAIIGGNTQGQFSIDSQNGEITLVKPLDYESIRSYRLVVRAQDGGSPGKSNTTQVLVNVKDVNDNSPRFYTSLFQESVSEGVPVGFSIVRVQAYDGDERENSEIEYRISPHFSPDELPVTVDPNTGWLSTRRQLDREATSRLNFEVLAVDKGDPPRSGTASVSIVIQDTNDNDPQFSPKEYSANLPEDVGPGASVVVVHATDPDENPRLNYEIMSGNTRGRFAITTQNGRGLITVAQPLDYKQERRFILSVRAIDSGGRYDTANVYINITDANTFSPIFDNAPYSASIPEDAKIGTTVLVVSASDGDSGVNAEISYSLSSDTTEFTINPDTGAIITTAVLDREITSGYLLSVTAKDNGTPQLSDSTDVEITVTDVNDNPPKFSQESYLVSVSEDVPIGTSILQVSATDPDLSLNGRVRYSLEDTDTFIMEPITGVVRVNRGLDRESTAQYTLIAIASDRASPPLSSSVEILVKIEDVNDSPPSFESDKLKLYIPENSPIGSTVGEIYASDPDVGANAYVTYSIIGGEDSSLFSLQRRAGNDKAELTTLTELDYESSKKTYSVVIRASSAPLRSDATVTIIVTDVNDNAPKLSDFQVIFNNFRECFPSGPIGKIPAFDADVSDKLRYRLLSGNNAALVTLNETSGELSLSPQLNTNVPKLATMEVSVSDGMNEVKAWMELTVRLITDEMLMNSVTVRLGDMTEQAFLSPLYTYFVEAVAAIVPCPKHNVYIFSIQEDSDTDARILNVSFSVRKPDGEMYPAQLLQERVHLNRELLNKLSTLQVLEFDDNLCVREPCINFEECLTVLKFGNASGFLTSSSMLFRPIYPVTTFACRCPAGFIGRKEHYLCDTEVNLCYSSPCKNGGECVQAEGGYTCICSAGFTGETCETDVSASCGEACPEGSTCTPLESGGYTCESCQVSGASFQHYDRFCQLRARSFSSTSYLTFTPLRQRYRMHIKLKFSTVESGGLLIYNGRYNMRHDFIALELIDGNIIQFSFSLGSKVTRVSAVAAEPLNDGSWHTVTIIYYNKTATISLDDCDTAVAVKFGDRINMTCAGEVTEELESRCALVTESCHRFVDLTGPLQLGGLPPGMSPPHLSYTSFIGCLADIYIDHKLLDLNKFVGNNGTKVGCLERESYCSSSPCQNGGTCRESWGGFLCDCQDGWSGSDCSQGVGQTWSFDSEGELIFNPLLRPIQLPWETQFSLRTVLQDGFIMGVAVGQNSTALFTLESGYLKYSIDSDSVILSSWRVADGLWHRAVATVAPTGLATLIVDGARKASASLSAPLQGQFIGRISVGASDGYHPFSGCIKDIRLGSWQGLQLVQNPTSSSGVGSSCPQDSQCSSCPPNSHCKSSWHKSSCACNAGYVGEECDSVCNLNPCHNGGYCLHDKDSPLGYSCVCNTTIFTGDYCEKEKSEICPSSWWGQPNCGPCNCDISRGYSPNCDQKTGDCTCKESHYFASEEIGCLPCDCYSIGSLSPTCDRTTGQCDCKSGVGGLKCDQCPNPYAQVTSLGCEVVYGGCPRSKAGGVWWERSDYGTLSSVACPQGTNGRATRLCDRSLPGWRPPDVFNCTSNSFVQLRRLLSQLEAGDVSMNTYVAVETVKSLSDSINNTRYLTGADSFISIQLTARLLQYESSLSGLSLSHVQHDTYISRLVFILSELLSTRTLEYWPRLETLTSESPHYLHSLFAIYMSTLAANMRDTYTQPFETIADNLVLGLDTVSSESLYGYEVLEKPSALYSRSKEAVVIPDTTNILQPPIQGASVISRNASSSPTIMFPKYNNFVKRDQKFDEFSRLLLPTDLLGIKEVMRGDISITGSMRTQPEREAIVSYAMFKEVEAWPKRFDHSVITRWGLDLQVGSTIFTVVATNKEGTVLGSGLKSPVRLQLWLSHPVKSPRTNPQCVRWTHVRGFGEWTRAGCITELPTGDWWRRPLVLVNCTCTTLSTHAVLIDLLDHQYVREASEAEEAMTWIGLPVSLWCLAMTLLILNISGKGNRAGISANMSVCLLAAEGLFLIALKGRSPLLAKPVLCKLTAIGLHYSWLCALCWWLMSSVHLYRMLTQLRDVNRGPMVHYYTLCYAVPGVIVSLAVAVRPHQYASYYFCWISLHESVIWSMIGPGIAIVLTNIIVLSLSLKAAFTVNQHIAAYGDLRTLVWINVGIAPLAVGAWLACLVNATEHGPGASLCLALCLPIHSGCLLIAEASTNHRLRRWVLSLTNGKPPPPPPSVSITSPSPLQRCGTAPTTVARRHLGISNSSTTSTTKTSSSPYRSDNQLRNTSTSTSNYEQTSERRVTHTSDSESEGSERSLELASSHSSDEESSGVRRQTNLTMREPPHLNIDTGLFQPIYSWPVYVHSATHIQEENGRHRWTGSTISDNETPGKVNNMYSDSEEKASIGDKYLFPYTAEEDHSEMAGSPSPLTMQHHLYPRVPIAEEYEVCMEL